MVGEKGEKMILRQPLWLLLILPALAFFIFSLKRRNAVSLSPIHLLKNAGRSWRIVFWWLPEFFTLAFCVTAALLIAGPERQIAPDTEETNGLAIVLAFDRSSSMSAVIPYGNDHITRIEGVKAVTRDFCIQRKNDQFALVSFARYPETNTPLTSNKTILLDFLNLLKVPETQEEDGTAIGDALVLATAHLLPGADAGKKKGIIILLTDGQNNSGEKTPAEGADIAQAAGATIYTIGLGGDGYIMKDGPNGPQAVGMPVSIDEETLSAIARKTGGRYYRSNGLSDLASFYQDIAKRETTKLEQTRAVKMELNLEPGLRLLLALLFLNVLTRSVILRRRDS